jgi:hypothetical protein
MEDVDSFEFRIHDPATGEWFYQTASSWEEFEEVLLSVSEHRGHPMELWAISRYDANYGESEAPWRENDGSFTLPWKRVAYVRSSGVAWQPSMNGPVTMGAARKRRVKPTQMKLAQADRLASKVEDELTPYSDYIKVVGSVRRRVPTVGDVEFVVLPKDLEEFLGILAEEGFHGGDRKQVGSVKGMPVEIYIAHDPKELGGLVLMYTGDFTMNIAMRMKAKKRGLKLNQYGIWKGAKPVLQSDDEVDFFDFLGVRYHEPEERSLSRRVKPKKAVRAPKMSGGDDWNRFWDGEEE